MTVSDERSPDERSPDEFELALSALQRRTGMERNRIIAEAVAFANARRTEFAAHLRRDIHKRRPANGPVRRFIARHGTEIAVAALFLLGSALAALQIMQQD